MERKFCPACGMVTRHGADGRCTGAEGARQGTGEHGAALPLAELETGAKVRPVIALRPWK